MFACIVLYFFNLAFVRRRHEKADSVDDTLNQALKQYSGVILDGMKFIEAQDYEWHYINSFDKVKLAGRYFDNNSTCTIFLFHGYRSSASHDFCCAVEMYLKMGFNVLLIDQRAHGKSKGKLITFGVKESRDVLEWVKYVNKMFKPKQIILSGISMGATTVLLSLYHKLPDNVKGVVADCGFTSPADIIVKVGKDNYKINARFFIPFLDIACRLFGGFSIRNISTVEAVKRSNLPILFIHGEKDNFVPCEMTKTTFAVCSEKCRMFLSKEARHGMSFLTDTDLVLKEIKDFLTFCIDD